MVVASRCGQGVRPGRASILKAKLPGTLVTAKFSASTFDSKAQSYDDEPKRKRATWVADLIRSRPWFANQAAGNGLDFGCGTGLLSFELERHLNSVTGIDVSAGMISTMKEKIASAGLSHKMTATVQPLSSLGSFDLIFSMLCFHHLKDCGAQVKDLAQHLNPGGRLVVVDLEATANVRLFHKKDELVGEHYEHDGLPVFDLQRWLKEAGLVDEDLTRAAFEKEVHACWNRAGREEYQMLIASGAKPR